MKLPTKIYISYCIFMGGYGCSRGYRIKEATFTTDKVISGFFNGVFYSMPIFNIEPTLRLLNRLEIKYKNIDKNSHLKEYKEFIGSCLDDI